MRTIWKQELEMKPLQTIQIPFDAKILSVQLQNGNPCIWYLVPHSHNNLEPRDIAMGLTGQSLGDEDSFDEYRYISTVIVSSSLNPLTCKTFVMHWFEVQS